MKVRKGVDAFSEAEESLSPRDTKGHSSHTASTTVGFRWGGHFHLQLWQGQSHMPKILQILTNK